MIYIYLERERELTDLKSRIFSSRVLIIPINSNVKGEGKKVSFYVEPMIPLFARVKKACATSHAR